MGFFDSIVDFGKDVLGGIGGAITDLPGALLGRGMDMFSAKQAFDQSKEGSEYAFNRTAQEYAKRYQTTAKDLRQAGLNPILAATGGFSVGNAPVMAPPQSFNAPGHYMGGSSQSAKNVAETSQSEAQTKKAYAEVEQALSQAAKNRQDIEESLSRILKNREETKVATQTERNLGIAMFNLEKDFEIKAKEVYKIEQEIQLLTRQTTQTSAQTDQTRALTAKVADERRLLVQQAREIKSIADKLGKVADVYNGPAGSLLGGVNAITDALNLHTVIAPRR